MGCFQRIKARFGYGTPSTSVHPVERGDNHNTTASPNSVTESQECSPTHSADIAAGSSDRQIVVSEPAATSASRQYAELSKKLWDRAYDSLENDEVDLVQSYKRILAKELAEDVLEDRNKNIGELTAKDSSEKQERKRLIDELLRELDDSNTNKATPNYATTRSNNASSTELEQLTTNIVAKLSDRTKRQQFMDMLVEKGRFRVSRAQKFFKAAAAASGVVQFIEPAVDIVLQIPQAMPAALPWAGICLGLKILSQPAESAQSQRVGFAYVAFRMKWYYEMTDALLNQDNKKDTGKTSEVSILNILEESLCALYKAVLLYQMKSVCYIYCNFLRQAFNKVDWEGSRKVVEDAEDAFMKDWNCYKKVQADKLWNKHFKAVEKSNQYLQKIGRSLENFVGWKMDSLKDRQNNKCLRDLYVVNPLDDMTAIERDKGLLCKSVSEWVLNRGEYTKFTSPDSSDTGRLLWIKGPAGTGKTMLMVGIIRQLLAQPAEQALSLSYYFCQSRNEKRNTATASMRTLLWMLLFQQPHLIEHHCRVPRCCSSASFAPAAPYPSHAHLF